MLGRLMKRNGLCKVARAPLRHRVTPLARSSRFSPAPQRNFAEVRPAAYPVHFKQDSKSYRSQRAAAWGQGLALAASTISLMGVAWAEEGDDGDEEDTSGFFPGPEADNLDGMRVFSGRANPELAQEIVKELGIELGQVKLSSFADGEIGIQVDENVRGKDVYIIQPTCPPGVNDNLMELILMVSTMRRASAQRITAVIPYYGYARQDRKLQSRVPISAADVARLLQSMGVDRVVAVDLHCGQIQGFFGPRTPCDNLEGLLVALPHFKNLGLNHDNTKVVSPDAGGVYRAKRFREGLSSVGQEAGLAMIIKQRIKANQVGEMDLVGEVANNDVIIVDDMIDTAGTLTKAAQVLKDKGANRVFAFATHGLFSGPALERIENSALEQVVVCDTIPLRKDGPTSKIHSLSIAPLLAKAIKHVHTKKSISGLFREQLLENALNGHPEHPPSNPSN